ncbi:hypothetical protein VNO80_30427 [Phaseolus coccineus]|uniref:Uncharacterized protein n=1 Tax=Phaseolus coccineus TaxID=3886 RepID=A0AAN9QDF9_PHACN
MKSVLAASPPTIVAPALGTKPPAAALVSSPSALVLVSSTPVPVPIAALVEGFGRIGMHLGIELRERLAKGADPIPMVVEGEEATEGEDDDQEKGSAQGHYCSLPPVRMDGTRGEGSRVFQELFKPVVPTKPCIWRQA